jgi:tetratricopeptide (TPR) repeat protein
MIIIFPGLDGCRRRNPSAGGRTGVLPFPGPVPPDRVFAWQTCYHPLFGNSGLQILIMLPERFRFSHRVWQKEEKIMDMEDLKQERQWVEHADLLDSQGKYEKAVVAYDNALAIVPDDADVLFNKGTTLVKLGKTPEAMQCFETATQMYISGLG